MKLNWLVGCFQSSPVPDTPSDRDGARSRMTSPARDFEPFEDEGDILGDNPEEEEDEGEELFNDNMEALVKIIFYHIHVIAMI